MARFALRLKRLRVERPSRVFRPSASAAGNLRFFFRGVAEKLLFRGERRAVCECGYICSSSRPPRPGPWRRHGEKQECDRQGRTRRTRRNPASASVSSLLVFIASFVCTVAAPPKTKDAKGVLRRRGPVEATWEGDGSPLKCTLIAANQKNKNNKETGKKNEVGNNSGLLLCQEVLVKWQKLVFSLHLSLPHLICCCCSSSSPPPSSLVSFFNLFGLSAAAAIAKSARAARRPSLVAGVGASLQDEDEDLTGTSSIESRVPPPKKKETIKVA